MNSWILVAIAIIGGIIVGFVLSRLVGAFVDSESRPEPIRQVARPLSSLAMAIGVVGGLVIALGIIQPDSLDRLTEDAIGFIPKVLSAVIIVIVANVLSSFATTALSQALSRMPAHIERQATMLVRGVIVALAVLLAVGQLGVNTDVVNLGVAAVFFGIAASLTLLVGLGGHGVAREVASTRALKRLVGLGDTVTVGDTSGVVAAVHPTAVELTLNDGATVLVPSSRFVNQRIAIDRVERETADSSI